MLKKRDDFPLLRNNQKLIYFDTAATAQRPQRVLDAVMEFYTQSNANAGRAIYNLAEKATQNCDTVRTQLKTFINAESSSEIIFTKGTTEALNFIATAWGQKNIEKGDEIVVTALEHHANFVPWQQLCKRTGAVLKVIPVDHAGELQINPLEKFITAKTKLVAMTHISNALGLPNPYVKTLVQAARRVGARVLIDGAQAAHSHVIDVQKLGCDFYAFSGHKMYGPTGVGVLYIKKEVQSEVPPYQFGGGAVQMVTTETVTFLDAPYCYEPGTQPLAQIAGFGVAIEYIQSIGLPTLFEHENKLLNQLIDGLEVLPEITLLGSKERLRNEATIVSFLVKGVHPHDVAAFFDTKGICVRAGHHCAQPLAQALSYSASVRVSFGVYNNAQEVSYFLTCLKELLASDFFIKHHEIVAPVEPGRD